MGWGGVLGGGEFSLLIPPERVAPAVVDVALGVGVPTWPAGVQACHWRRRRADDHPYSTL